MSAGHNRNPSHQQFSPWRYAPIPRARQNCRRSGSAAALWPRAAYGASVLLRPMALITESHRKRGIAPMMESTMKNFAEFQILGRVGKIKEFDGKVNVTVCANYPTKKDGETRDNPHWNEVSIFAEAVRNYATKYAKAGDLVFVRGRVKQNSFERNGEKVYTVDMVAEDFSILASKAEKADESSEQSEPAKKPARRGK